jgi:AcrR family transcriptional regulator
VGVKTPKASDRRVQRTRRTLREALISLMLERGWDAVSVQDVCDRADVGRSTFYTHFADKEELLVGGFDDLRKMVRAQVATSSALASPLGFAHGMIEHAHEHQRLFRALVGKRSGQVVLRRFRELVIDLAREDLALVAEAGATRDAAAHFVAGAFLEMLTWWLETRTPLSPADLERLFVQMAAPALAGAAGRPTKRRGAT